MEDLERLSQTVTKCRKCPRLVRWRERVAKDPPPRYRGQTYWARPLPGFGDRRARLLVVGLAPAAHGGNRTGRIFTGDRSGDWLYEALYRFGFSNRPASVHRDDGLELRDCYVTAAVRCAPPGNKPLPVEFDNCRPYLVEELRLLTRIQVIVALGKIAFDSFLKAYEKAGGAVPRPRPQFRHGGCFELGQRVVDHGPSLMLLGSYHPSQQNTFTGRLTTRMFHAVFAETRKILEGA